jgi:hypothetical protein
VRPAFGPRWGVYEQRRLHAGKGACFVFGVLLVLLTFTPVACIKLHSYNSSYSYRQARDEQTEVLWRWSTQEQYSGTRAWGPEDMVVLRWIIALLPAALAALAIVAAFRPPWGRGVFAFLAGAGLLFCEPTMRSLAAPILMDAGPLFPPYSVVYSLLFMSSSLMLAFLCLAMATGGHRAAMYARGHFAARLAALIPAFFGTFPLLFGLMMAIYVVTRQAPGISMPEQPWLTVVIAAVASGGIGILSLIVCGILGLVNGALGDERVARSGHVFGIVGFIALLCCMLIFFFSGITVGGASQDQMLGVGMLLHAVIPLAAGVVLVAGGYDRMWLCLLRSSMRDDVYEPPVPAVQPQARPLASTDADDGGRLSRL